MRRGVVVLAAAADQARHSLLVPRTLESRGALHGYGLCAQIRSVSEDTVQVEEGSLYPALHRMEQDGWISAQWEVTAKGRNAKKYSITALGRKQLEDERETWARLTRGVTCVLRYS
ncbi:MAG: PadR family transcriptional regulator [Bryobacteraceae bacterium]|nr:PadR family transcriptional regulator [Bryobacteraceae bacterium]